MLPSGECFDCPSDKVLLDAAHAAGVLISYSCRGGQCRSCLVRILTGEVAYPRGLPPALDDAEAAAGLALCCSALPKSDLAIELQTPGL